MLQKLKDDEVTEFALTNQSCIVIPKVNDDLKLSALVTLAKHKAIVKMITKIREKIPNWTTELASLLNSFKKKKKKAKQKIKTKEKFNVPTPTKDNKLISVNPKTSPKVKSINVQLDNSDDADEKTNQVLKNKSKTISELNKTKVVKSAVIKEPEKVDKLEEKFTEKEPEKIEDTFFIQKKVIAPKPVQYSRTPGTKKSDSRLYEPKQVWGKEVKNQPKINRDVLLRNNYKEAVSNKDDLHPSWAAKKIPFIKPFEGKKVKFSLED